MTLPPRLLRPWWQAALASVLAGTTFSVFGNVPGMGLPGALVAIPGVLLAALFVAIPADPFPRDSAWPYFILVTLLWGPAVPLCWLGTRALGWRGTRRAVGFIGGFVLCGVLVAAATYLIGVAPML